MINSKHFGVEFLIVLILTKASTSQETPCNWKLDVDCWLYCTDDGSSADVIHSIEEKWNERPQCQAGGISLGMSTVNTNNTGVLQANWFKSTIKVNYLEFGEMTGVDEIEENAFNTEAFKSVKQLVFKKMNKKMLKSGAFNGLQSLEVLKIKGAYELRHADLGILDGLNATLKELTIERNGSYRWIYIDKIRKSVQEYEANDSHNALRIYAFTGSQQTLNLEHVKIRYYMQRLGKESFVGLKKIKNLDLANCGIQWIGEGTFDPVIGTVKVIRLTNNPFKNLPNGMLDFMPLRYDTYIFIGQDGQVCECQNLPVNYIATVSSCPKADPYKVDKLCNLYLPTKRLSPVAN